MPTLTVVRDAGEFFAGPGEMRALCRAFDWSKTALGSVEDWSHSLRTIVATLLASPHPMFLWWGPELVQIYNDAYRPSLAAAGRHPIALGMRGPEFWSREWDVIGSDIQRVMLRGESRWRDDQLVPIERRGRMEEVYWTYGYSPVVDDDGSIGGVLVVCQETTERVLAARRLRTLHRIAALHSDVSTSIAAGDATRLLATEQLDVPFALCFLTADTLKAGESLPKTAQAKDDSRSLSLTLGYAAHVPVGSPLRDPRNWPLDLVSQSREPQIVSFTPTLAGAHTGPWPEDPNSAVVVPFMAPSTGTELGVLVVGISPRLPWNEWYEDFIRDAARDAAMHVAMCMHNAERERLYKALDAERARLEYIFRQAPFFLAVMMGPNFVVELANEAFCKIVGHHDVVGKSIFDAVPEGRGQGFEELMTRVLRTGEPFIGREIGGQSRSTPEGPMEQRYVDACYMPIFGEDGSCVGLVIHGADITDHVFARREVERLLHESNTAKQAAEQANMAKAQFLATMSHELRTPLNAIAGYCELIEIGVHGPVTEAQMQSIHRIQSSERHLLGLINDMLNYTRVEAGAVQYDVEPISVAEAILMCESLTAPQMRTKGHLFEKDIADFSLRVFADEEKLRQILLNLLSNAIKFTDSGGAVTVKAELASDDVVAIRVIDSGRGIQSDQLEKIFDPFVQVDAELTRVDQGLGLGLAISRDLARGMGGDLTAVSEVGKGSTFTLTLPRAIA